VAKIIRISWRFSHDKGGTAIDKLDLGEYVPTYRAQGRHRCAVESVIGGMVAKLRGQPRMMLKSFLRWLTM
jgi:hypothetical protein